MNSTDRAREDTPEDAPVEEAREALGRRSTKPSSTATSTRRSATIAKEVKLPGFRAGKVPRKVLEARIGLAAAREQALRDAVPQYLAQRGARARHRPDRHARASSSPAAQESGPVSFDATCEVRPEITVPGYGGLRVELPSPVGHRGRDRRGRRGRAPPSGHRWSTSIAPVQSGDHVTHQPRRHPRRRAGRRPQHRGLALRGRQGLGGRGFRRASCIGATAGDELDVHRHPQRHRRAGRLRRQRHQGPRDGAAGAHRRVGRREPRRVRHGGGVARRVWPSASAPASSTRPATSSSSAPRRRSPNWSTSSRPSRMVQADLQGRVQNTVQQFQSQGISSISGCRSPGRTPTTFIDSAEGAVARRRSRSTSRCVPSPSPRASR